MAEPGGVLLALLVSVASVGYVMLRPDGTPKALALGAPTSATGDCADLVITAITSPSPAAAEQAYQCMTPAFQQSVSEPVFEQQLQALRVPNVTRVDRLGTYQAPTGGTLVYYAVDTSGRSIAFVVYLGPDGKVAQIK